MKFKLHVAGFNVLLSAAQLEVLTDMLADSEHIKEDWVGAGKGENGSNYAYRIVKCDTALIQPNLVRDDEIAARRLATKLLAEGGDT